MQYPIIDLISSAYINNGWTGLEITESKNLFNLNRETKLPIPPDILITPRIMETKGAYVGLRSDNYYYSGYVTTYTNDGNIITVSTNTNIRYGVGFPVEIEANTSYTFSYTRNNTFFSIGVYDSEWNYIADITYSNPNNSYTLTTPNNAKYITIIFGSAELDTVGTASQIQLELGTEATPYEPYAPPTTDIANRLKLPLPHYFQHAVIDALQRAAAGTQTADDTEILQHYLTPLGIGGI